MATSLEKQVTTRTNVPPATAPVAYIMSRFPKLTETFVLYEILAAERCGAKVEVYPLRREKCTTMHAEAEAVVARAHFTPWLSVAILTANLRMFVQKPIAYLSTLWVLFRANFGSARYLAGAMLYFPKAVFMAVDMQRRGVRHVHAHFASHPAAVAFVIWRLAKIPFSFTAHGSDLHCDRHMLREKVDAADAVVAISQYNRDLILSECGQQYADKVVVIHCGVDTNQFIAREEPTPFDRGAGPFSIVCVGTLHEVKGQTFLLQACGELKQQGVNFRCHLIGDGEDHEMLSSLAKELDIEDAVIFHGLQTREQVLAHLRNADVLATPSVPTQSGRREGIPVVLMEAMASGVPVVASRLSGIPELVTEGSGLLTTPRDASDVAASLRRLHEDADLRRELSLAGRRRVEEEFDQAKNAKALLAHFRG